jgi:glutaredoxin
MAFSSPSNNGDNMRIIQAIAICLILLQITASPIGAVMYKWVDQNGVVHFSDTPPATDQELETRATTTYTAPAPAPERRKPEKAARPVPQKEDARKVTQRKVSKPGDNKVEIFTTTWCGYCKKAIALLKANHIPFKQHDIEKEAGTKKRMMAMGGRGGVPFAIINDQKIYGFSEGTYKRVLGLAQ